jgi:hypothetical protein
MQVCMQDWCWLPNMLNKDMFVGPMRQLPRVVMKNWRKNVGIQNTYIEDRKRR